MHDCFLLLGSNLGNRSEILSRAGQEINDKIGEIRMRSSVYETEAWGFKAEQFFLNLVIQVDTELSAESVLKRIFKIERGLGRVRNSKGFASRAIDIDILFYDDEVIDDPQLQVPHPRLHERMFALVPLMEIDPGKMHAKLQKTISDLFLQCTDQLEVKKFMPNTKAFAEQNK